MANIIERVFTIFRGVYLKSRQNIAIETMHFALNNLYDIKEAQSPQKIVVSVIESQFITFYMMDFLKI